jgi:hypothetical protein
MYLTNSSSPSKAKRVRVEPPPKTGWPPPELMQDDHKGLSKWFATRLGARQLLKELYERGQAS